MDCPRIVIFAERVFPPVEFEKARIAIFESSLIAVEFWKTQSSANLQFLKAHSSQWSFGEKKVARLKIQKFARGKYKTARGKYKLRELRGDNINCARKI